MLLIFKFEILVERACIAVKEETLSVQSLLPSTESNVLSTSSIRKIDAICNSFGSQINGRK